MRMQHDTNVDKFASYQWSGGKCKSVIPSSIDGFIWITQCVQITTTRMLKKYLKVEEPFRFCLFIKKMKMKSFGSQFSLQLVILYQYAHATLSTLGVLKLHWRNFSTFQGECAIHALNFLMDYLRWYNITSDWVGMLCANYEDSTEDGMRLVFRLPICGSQYKKNAIAC